jgi:hypothetical protein
MERFAISGRDTLSFAEQICALTGQSVQAKRARLARKILALAQQCNRTEYQPYLLRPQARGGTVLANRYE